jgi:hypothetical protein
MIKKSAAVSRRVKSTSKVLLPDIGIPRIFDARPDTVDFRDLMYVPTLTEVPVTIRLQDYQKAEVPVLDQGSAGACTGFGLATVGHYLLRTRTVFSDHTNISPWMLYAMAQQFDVHDASAGYSTPDNPNVGATCRSAVKGWNQNGVCRATFYTSAGAIQPPKKLAGDARLRPLGAYFRVNHKDLVAMHTSLAEVKILYASAQVHMGWQQAGADGIIKPQPGIIGGHAFAIVAYNKGGFWIQNSWGSQWGKAGFGYVSYDDWLTNGTDVWVVRLGVPVDLPDSATIAIVNTSSLNVQSSSDVTAALSPHIVSVGDNGFPLQNGQWANSPADIENVFTQHFPIDAQGWNKKRLVLYAHGGLVSESSAVERIGYYSSYLRTREAYLVGFVWHTDYLTTLGEILHDAVSKVRPEGFLGKAKDFLLDRLDDTLEPIARIASGKMEWDKMKTNASAASQEAGGAYIAAQAIKRYAGTLSPSDAGDFEIHLVGHSAGSIFLAPLIKLLTNDLGLTIQSCTLWAPACTTDVFRDFYMPAIGTKKIGQFALVTLDDHTERADNCAHIYNKSLLYLVSDAFETHFRVPLMHPDGEPLLGMAKFVEQKGLLDGLGENVSIADWLRGNGCEYINSPNQARKGTPEASTATQHGGFSGDETVLLATVARITGQDQDRPQDRLQPPVSASALEVTKRALQRP